MEVQIITEDKLDVICSICLDPSVDKRTRDIMGRGIDNRIAWVKKMMLRGLEILVALEEPREERIYYKWVGEILHSDLAVQGQVPMGLLEYIPLELALEPIHGKNSLFINCMWILPPFWHTGVGKALIESLIERAKQYGGVSVVAYDGDKWFGTSIKYMPSSFFKKFGFKEVDRKGTRVLLYLDLGSNMKPKFIHPKINPIIGKSPQVVIDVFFNSQCPWSKYMINNIKTKVRDYPNINVNIINTDSRELIEMYGISRGVRINGRPVIERMASWNEIKIEIDKVQKEFHKHLLLK
ncbi:MAG: GNAT family N-acetyltransferase [Promethearchaeota archaeon]